MSDELTTETRNAMIPEAPRAGIAFAQNAPAAKRREIIFLIDKENSTRPYEEAIDLAIQRLAPEIAKNGTVVKKQGFTGLPHLGTQLSALEAGGRQQAVVLTAGYILDGALAKHVDFLQKRPEASLDFVFLGGPEDRGAIAAAQMIPAPKDRHAKAFFVDKPNADSIQQGIKISMDARAPVNVWAQHDRMSEPVQTPKTQVGKLLNKILHPLQP